MSGSISSSSGPSCDPACCPKSGPPLILPPPLSRPWKIPRRAMLGGGCTMRICPCRCYMPTGKDPVPTTTGRGRQAGRWVIIQREGGPRPGGQPYSRPGWGQSRPVSAEIPDPCPAVILTRPSAISSRVTTILSHAMTISSHASAIRSHVMAILSHETTIRSRESAILSHASAI